MSAEDPKAVVQLIGDDLFSGRTPSGHNIKIDTDRERNSASSPMELLLVALGSCTGVDVISILRKKRETITGYRVEVRGQEEVSEDRQEENDREADHEADHEADVEADVEGRAEGGQGAEQADVADVATVGHAARKASICS